MLVELKDLLVNLLIVQADGAIFFGLLAALVDAVLLAQSQESLSANDEDFSQYEGVIRLFLLGVVEESLALHKVVECLSDDLLVGVFVIDDEVVIFDMEFILMVEFEDKVILLFDDTRETLAI